MIQYMWTSSATGFLERSTRRRYPTHQASVLFRETEGIFERVRRAAEFAKSLKKGAGETLSVLSYYSSAMTTVRRVMFEVSKRYPDVAFSLDVRNPGSQISQRSRLR
jgi:DNA-binding transcriptional LysR family regulator